MRKNVVLVTEKDNNVIIMTAIIGGYRVFTVTRATWNLFMGYSYCSIKKAIVFLEKTSAVDYVSVDYFLNRKAAEDFTLF